MNVARRIVRDIQRSGMSPGQSLPPEFEMLATFNVGRASLREALRMLEVQGLISIKPGPGGGPVVEEPTGINVGRLLSLQFNRVGATYGDVVRARLLVDPPLARLASAQRSQEELADLRDIVDRARRIPVRNDAEWARVVSTFNSVVAAMSGNAVQYMISGALRTIYVERITTIRYTERMRALTIKRYDAIVDAIASGDGDQAELAMHDLIEDSIKQMTRHYPETLRETVDWQ